MRCPNCKQQLRDGEARITSNGVLVVLRCRTLNCAGEHEWAIAYIDEKDFTPDSEEAEKP